MMVVFLFDARVSTDADHLSATGFYPTPQEYHFDDLLEFASLGDSFPNTARSYAEIQMISRDENRVSKEPRMSHSTLRIWSATFQPRRPSKQPPCTLQPCFNLFLQQRYVVLRPLAHNLPEDLPTSRLGYLVHKNHTTSQPLVLRNSGLDPALNVLLRHCALETFFKHYVCPGPLLVVQGDANHSGVCNCFVFQQYSLELGGCDLQAVDFDQFLAYD